MNERYVNLQAKFRCRIQHHTMYQYMCFLCTVQHNFVLTSSQMSCLLTPGLRFMIFSSAAFSTPSCVNSTFGLPCSPSTLTFRKYLRSNVTYGRYWAVPHLQSVLSTAGGMVARGGTDNSKQTYYCAMNKKMKIIYLL